MSEPTDGGRARAYQALRESEELHRLTVESISDAVFITDDDGRFTFICPNVDVIFGYTPDEVEAMGSLGRFLGDGLFDPAELRAQGEIRNVEREVVCKSGQRRVVLIHFKRVSIQGATVLCSCRDVTELKHAERELSAAMLDALSSLPGTIIHGVADPHALDLRVPTISFSVAGMPATSIAQSLDEHAIGVRDGHMYSPRLMSRLRLGDGVVRASLVHYNTLDEIERFREALVEITSPRLTHS